MSPERIETCRRWRMLHRDRANEQNRAWYSRNPQKRRDSANEWRRRNKEKRRAHRMVEYALSKGKLFKQPCAKCAAVVAEAHHHDYAKPLDVTWLCRQCHAKEHRGA